MKNKNEVTQAKRRGGGLALALRRDQAAVAGAAFDHVVAAVHLATAATAATAVARAG